MYMKKGHKRDLFGSQSELQQVKDFQSKTLLWDDDLTMSVVVKT